MLKVNFLSGTIFPIQYNTAIFAPYLPCFLFNVPRVDNKAHTRPLHTQSRDLNEPVHEISNNMVCATNKASDQPAHTRSLIRAFASRLSIL